MGKPRPAPVSALEMIPMPADLGCRRQFLMSTVLFPLSVANVVAEEHRGDRSTADVSVVPNAGVPMFVVDGRPLRSATFETYAPQHRYFEQFAAAGTRLFSFSTNAAACDYGHSQDTWVDPESWDYSQFEARAEMILRSCPDALLLPRVNLGTPRWWLAENESELERFEDGSSVPEGHHPTLPSDRAFPSLASATWRAAIADALRRLIRHVDHSRFGNHVIGWLLSGGHTEEWYHWSCNTPLPAGYSIPTRTAFRRWLAAKYRDDRALQFAWGDHRVTLASADVPSAAQREDGDHGDYRDPETQMQVVDFYLFWSDLVVETIDHFAGAAKSAGADRQVVGAFYGYLYEFAGDPEFGHNSVSHLLRSPHLDFMAVTASYFSRQSAAGSDYQRSPAASLRLHGKLWYHDNDVVSYRAKQLMIERGFTSGGDWTRDRSLQLKLLGYTETPQQSHAMYRRGWGFAFTHGMHHAWFDLHGGYFDAPDLMNEIARLNVLAADPRLTPRDSVAQILIVADERSCAYFNPRSTLLKRTLTDPQNQLTRLGAPSDHVLLDDLHLVDADRYRLIVFLNCCHVDDAQRAAVKRWQRSGKHLVWFGAPGWFHGNTRSLEGLEALTGFEFEQASGSAPSIRSPGLGAGNRLLYRTATNGKFAEIHVPTGHPEGGHWTSYYCSEPNILAADLRTVARRAGVHLFIDTDDVLYANESLVVLHAADSGRRRIRFPVRAHVSDLITGQTWQAAEDIAQEVQSGETLLFHWTPLPVP